MSFALGITPSILRALVRAQVLARGEARIGRRVDVARVRVGWGSVRLEGLVVDGEGAPPPVVVPALTLRVSLSALLRGRARVEELVVEQPRVELVHGGGKDNFSTMLTRLLRPAPSRASTESGAGLEVERARIVGGTLWIFDDGIGELSIAAIDAELQPGQPIELKARDLRAQLRSGPRLSAQRVTAQVPRRQGGARPLPSVVVQGGAVQPIRGVNLTGIDGTVQPDEADAERLAVELRGSYGGATVPLWNARGWVRLAERSGELKLRAERFRLEQLQEIFKQTGAPARVIDTQKGEVDARLDLSLSDKVARFVGQLHVAGLTVAHPMLAAQAIDEVSVDGAIDGSFDLGRRALELRRLDVRYGKINAHVTATVENLGATPKVSARLAIDPLACQSLLESFPDELVPALRGFHLAGTFSTDLHFGVDLADLAAPVDLGGKVGIEGCKVAAAPWELSVERLKDSFEQTVEVEPGRWRTFVIGPENPDFAPYAEISPHLVNSIMTTEDNGFFRHRGFIPSEFRTALQQNLQRGYFRLGASSISMQMVKNVMLSREKTLSRKLQELFLTWYVEGALPKERILEIYFNAIEFGPDLYGIGRATRHYFGKRPRDLDPKEAAWFSSILPSPKRRYVQYCHEGGVVDAKWDAYLKRIMRRSHERGRLSDAEYEQALATPLRFDRTEAMAERACLAMVRRLVGPAPTARTSAPPRP